MVGAFDGAIFANHAVAVVGGDGYLAGGWCRGGWGGGIWHLLNIVLEALEALSPAGFVTIQVMAGFFCDAEEVGGEGEFGFAVGLVGEGDGVEEFEQGIAMGVQCAAGEDETLGVDDFPVCAEHGIDGSVRAAHVDVDFAAWADVPLAAGVGEAVRAPPLGQMGGMGPGLEDEAAGGVEYAGGDEFARGGGGCVFGGHG